MRDLNQKMRFTSAELALIKAVFADNEDLLFAIRKAMLQFELSQQEKDLLKGTINEMVYALLYKSFLPNLDPDSPIFQMTDLTIGLGADIKALNPDGAWPFIKAKDIEIKFISQQLKVLNGGTDKPSIILEQLGDLSGPKLQREQIYINVLARNFILSFVDSNISQLKTLAGLKTESVEETLKRLSQNSSK